MVIGVLSDSSDESAINIFAKGLSIDVVINTLTEVLTNSLDAALVDGVDMLNNDPIILVGGDDMFAVSLLCSVDALAGVWAGPVMKPIGARIEAAVEGLGLIAVSALLP